MTKIISTARLALRVITISCIVCFGALGVRYYTLREERTWFQQAVVLPQIEHFRDGAPSVDAAEPEFAGGHLIRHYDRRLVDLELWLIFLFLALLVSASLRAALPLFTKPRGESEKEPIKAVDPTPGDAPRNLGSQPQD